MKDYLIYSLRIPEELHKKLKEQAEKEKRSINTMILIMIEEYIKKNTQKWVFFCEEIYVK